MASKKMTDDELSAVVTSHMADAIGFSSSVSSDISIGREKALDYYMGRPFGNEIEGRSQVISTDVCDTIESVLPSIIKVFCAGEEVVEFEPVGPEDEDEAKQKTDLANYTFYKENDGFLLLYTWFKDALLQKNGFVKHWWEEVKETKTETYQGLTEDEYKMVVLDDKQEIIEHTEYQVMVPVVDPQSGQIVGEQPITVHDVKIKKEIVKKQVRLANIPPEEVIMTRNAKSVDDCSLIGHISRKTRTQLLEMGYKESDLDDYGDDASMLNGEEQTRYADEGGYVEVRNNSNDESVDEIWYGELYVRVDFDGDGVAELRQICTLGRDASKIIGNEVWEDMIPINSITPIILPHKLIGRALADLEMDIQLIKSTVMRQWLDNMYLTNNSRMGAVNNQVNLDDLLTSRPGGVVRIERPDSLVPIVTPQLGNQAVQALEYIDTVKENRTGITKYNQGTDANSLNKTASGINAIMGAAQQRIDLITRVFAETGVKRLFKGIIQLHAKHQDVAKIIRIRNEFITVDPRQWSSDCNVTINVGLGTGNKDQQLVHLTQIMGIQKELILSPFASMISPENIYNSAAEVAKNSGFKNPAKFFTKPPTKEELAQQPPQPQQPPPPDPNMVKVQQDGEMQQQKMQADAQNAQAKIKSDEELRKYQEGFKHQERMQQLAFEQHKFNVQAENAQKLQVIEKVLAAQTARQQNQEEPQEDIVNDDVEQSANNLNGLAEALNNMANAFMAPRHTVAIRDDNGNIQGATSTPVMGN